jgi:ubiquinone/menaquinone biosynthesis C-methylase UbiE
MLAEARRRANGRIELVEASAEQLPFTDGEFDAHTFTYLLRYVDDPAATLRELARTVRAGGTIASLEFGVPRGPARPLWELYVRVGLPAAGAVIGRGWREAGSFLGGSIRSTEELRRRLSAPTSGRAAKASLAMPLEAMPALPAWPSLFARAPVCVADRERLVST